MFRFLHLGDVHLETAFACREETSRQVLREDLLGAFSRAIDCALDEGVHAVLIAGDLLDGSRLSFSTERFLAAQLRRLDEAGIRCLVVSGNHDPKATSPLRTLAWPSSFELLDSHEPRSIEIRDRDRRLVGRVVGAGHESAAEEANLAEGFPRHPSDVPNVGLLHTLVVSADGAQQHDRYAPCSARDLERTAYDYWALGHIHSRQRIPGSVEAWYCGCLQGRHPRERGEKGGLLVELEGRQAVRVEFRRFAAARWETLTLGGLEQVQGIEDLKVRVMAGLKGQLSDESAHWFLRLELEGRSPLASRLSDLGQRHELESELRDRLQLAHLELDTTRLSRVLRVERYRQDPHVLSETLKLIDEAMNDRRLRVQLARQLSPAQMSNEEADRYVGSLLKGLDSEAVARFVVGADEN